MLQLTHDHYHAVQNNSSSRKLANSVDRLQPTQPLKQPKQPIKIRKMKVRTLVSNDSAQLIASDALIPDLQISMTELSPMVLDAISSARKNVELQVYTSLVQNNHQYLKKIFVCEDKSRIWVKEAIEDISDTVTDSIVDDIMKGHYYIHKAATITKEEVLGIKPKEGALGGKTPEIVRQREQWLQAKINNFKADLCLNELGTHEDKVNSQALRASQFIKNIQKKQEEQRLRLQRKLEAERSRRQQAEQQRTQRQLRIKEQRHQALMREFQQKRKSKDKQKQESERREAEFKRYMLQKKSHKPLFQLKEQEYFQKFVVPDNNKKLEILKERKSEYKPINREELLEHEKEYMELKEDHEYQKNAAKVLKNQAKPPETRYYKSKFHNLIEQELKEKEVEEDPLHAKQQLYDRKLEYASAVKTNFPPRVSQLKKAQFQKHLQELKASQQHQRRSSEACRTDGKHNLHMLHKHIAELRAQGRIRYPSASNTIQHQPKPSYRNYLREFNTSRNRHTSIDYAQLAEYDADRVMLDLQKREVDAHRRQQYLTYAGGMNIQKSLQQIEKLDLNYMQSAKAKMALISKYQ